MFEIFFGRVFVCPVHVWLFLQYCTGITKHMLDVPQFEIEFCNTKKAKVSWICLELGQWPQAMTR